MQLYIRTGFIYWCLSSNGCIFMFFSCIKVMIHLTLAFFFSLAMHYATKPVHFETLKIHCPTSEGVSEVSERANEWAQRRAQAKRAVRSKRTSERCERTDERVAQYLRLYSCLFQTTVGWLVMISVIHWTLLSFFQHSSTSPAHEHQKHDIQLEAVRRSVLRWSSSPIWKGALQSLQHHRGPQQHHPHAGQLHGRDLYLHPRTDYGHALHQAQGRRWGNRFVLALGAAFTREMRYGIHFLPLETLR